MLYKRVWRTPSYRALGPDARLLYLWSFTNPEGANLSGLYHASPRQLQRALGEEAGLRERIAAALEELAVRPLVLYDEDGEVVWVVGRVEHTLRSPKQAVKMIREYGECPDSPLKLMFRKQYGETLKLP